MKQYIIKKFLISNIEKRSGVKITPNIINLINRTIIHFVFKEQKLLCKIFELDALFYISSPQKEVENECRIIFSGFGLEIRFTEQKEDYLLYQRK